MMLSPESLKALPRNGGGGETAKSASSRGPSSPARFPSPGTSPPEAPPECPPHRPSPAYSRKVPGQAPSRPPPDRPTCRFCPFYGFLKIFLDI